MARPTKLTKALQKQIVAALKTGASVEETCQHVGIAPSTFYDWRKRGEANEPNFSEFSEAVTCAYGDAKMAAMQALRTAMSPHKQVSTKIKTYKETRINKVTGDPYEYIETHEEKTVTIFAGDWRAGIEYLKRRHYDEWGDKARIDDWRTQAIADIKAGIIPFEALVEAFDYDLATDLFRAAGVPVQTGEA